MILLLAIPALFLLVFVFVVIIVAVTFLKKGKSKNELQALAGKLGFDYVKSGFAGQDKLIGEFEGFPVTITGYVNDKKLLASYIMVYSTKEGRISFSKALFSSKPKHRWGSIALETGSPRFNETFSTKGEKAKEVLTPDIQNLMVNLAKKQKFKLHVFPEKEGKKGIVTLATYKKFNANPVFAENVLRLLAMISRRMQGVENTA